MKEDEEKHIEKEQNVDGDKNSQDNEFKNEDGSQSNIGEKLEDKDLGNGFDENGQNVDNGEQGGDDIVDDPLSEHNNEDTVYDETNDEPPGQEEAFDNQGEDDIEAQNEESKVDL